MSSAVMPALRPARLHDGSLGYLYMFFIPAILIGGILLGRASGENNWFAFLPFAFTYGVTPLLQAWRARVLRPIPDSVKRSPGWQAYYRLLPLTAPPCQLAMLYVAGDAFAHIAYAPAARFALLFTTGLFSGMFAINIAHVLIHRRESLDRLFGGLLLSMVCFGSFKIVHLQVHHPLVGTPLDFATARRGQSIYAYWGRCLTANFATAVRCERERLAKLGKPIWASELVGWYLVSCLWLALAVALWGWMGAVFFLGQSLIAILKLDMINYLQHYGLERAQDGAGGWEPVQPRHAWSQRLYLHDLALLNLFRHADHHAHPHIPYQLLEVEEGTPRYPYNFVAMNGLSLIPPLFRRIVHPILDRMAVEQAAIGS